MDEQGLFQAYHQTKVIFRIYQLMTKNTNLTIIIFFQRLVVCLEESLFIHNIRDMKVLHTIRETPPNKNGLCALSIDSDHCYLAYPGHSSVGELQIFDALHLVRITFLVLFLPILCFIKKRA